jgi:hypothetical protein
LANGLMVSATSVPSAQNNSVVLSIRYRRSTDLDRCPGDRQALLTAAFFCARQLTPLARKRH